MPIFAFFVLFLLCALYKMRKSTQMSQKISDEFWETEHKADGVRKKDIEHLDYINIDFERLPFHEEDPLPMRHYEEKILDLKGEKILNLTGYTNTELKLMYGAPNLPVLTEYDSNYTTLVSYLAKWGTECYNLKRIDDAKILFEYGIQIGTDVSSNYILLATIYQSENQTDRIYSLIDAAENVRSLSKNTILKNLKQILLQDTSE